MRAIECETADCAHLHAADDEALVRAAMQHAASAHPDEDFPLDAAWQFVRSGAVDDTVHEDAAPEGQDLPSSR